MKRNYITFLSAAVTAVLCAFGGASKAQTTNTDKVHIGIIYPLSTHGTHAPADTNYFSAHLIAGVSAAEKGVAFSGFSTFVKHDLNGLAASGFSNHIGNKATGLLFAGFLNTYREAEGLQFAGFSNIATGDVESAQFAGFLNLAAGLKGAQFAGFANLARDVKGTQMAGFMNVAKNTRGSQLSGFANVSKNVDNQISGFVNAAEDVSGSQISGFINIARKVKGVQIAGFINVADSSDCPIGLINLVKNGQKSIGLSIDETQTALLSFRSGGKKLYGIIGAGYNFKNTDEDLYAFEAGLGAHFFGNSTLRLNTEIATLYLEDFRSGDYFKSSLRLFPALKLAKNLEIFGGPILNFITTNSLTGRTLVDDYILKRESNWNRDYFHAIYIGYAGGIHITF